MDSHLIFLFLWLLVDHLSWVSIMSHSLYFALFLGWIPRIILLVGPSPYKDVCLSLSFIIYVL